MATTDPLTPKCFNFFLSQDLVPYIMGSWKTLRELNFFYEYTAGPQTVFSQPSAFWSLTRHCKFFAVKLEAPFMEKKGDTSILDHECLVIALCYSKFGTILIDIRDLITPTSQVS